MQVLSGYPVSCAVLYTHVHSPSSEGAAVKIYIVSKVTDNAELPAAETEVNRAQARGLRR